MDSARDEWARTVVAIRDDGTDEVVHAVASVMESIVD